MTGGLLRLRASFSVAPTVPSPDGLDDDGFTSQSQNIARILGLSTTGLVSAYALTADGPVAVSFGGLSSAAVVVITTTSKVRVRLTTTDGAQQSVPVDDLLILMAKSVPVTGLDLTRLPGVQTEVQTFLGQLG